MAKNNSQYHRIAQAKPKASRKTAGQKLASTDKSQRAKTYTVGKKVTALFVAGTMATAPIGVPATAFAREETNNTPTHESTLPDTSSDSNTITNISSESVQRADADTETTADVAANASTDTDAAASQDSPVEAVSSDAAPATARADTPAAPAGALTDTSSNTVNPAAETQLHLSLDRNTIGADGQDAGIAITLMGVAKPGDEILIKIPKGQTYDTSTTQVEKLVNIGTTKFTQDNSYFYITDTIVSFADFSQTITLSSNNNYRGQNGLFTDVGDTTKTIEVLLNGQPNQSVEFTQMIKPGVNPKIRRIKPSSNYSKVVMPNEDYVYEYSANMANGIADSTSYASAQVNENVNWGTTITIPVPEGFVLNQEKTNAASPYPGTSITQPEGKGGDIIITVDKGMGSQGWKGAPGYRFVGRFDVVPGTSDETLSASGPSHLVTNLNQDGTLLLEGSTPNWTESIKGTASDTSVGPLSVSSSAQNEKRSLLLDDNPDNDPKFLASYGYFNNSILTLAPGTGEGSNPCLTLDFSNAFAVTSVSTPKITSDLTGVQYFDYVLHYVDGTESRGRVTPGQIASAQPGKTIKQADFYPDVIEMGSGTNNAAIYESYNLFRAHGVLSHTYLWSDDAHHAGDPVLRGDKLTTSITLSVDNWPNNQNGADARYYVKSSNTQTVIGEQDLSASIGVELIQNNNTPGSGIAGRLNIGRAYDGRDTTYYLKEPVFYMVLPAGLSAARNNDGSIKTNYLAGDPIISEQWIGSGKDAQEVIKFDYTGTGYYYPTRESGHNQIFLQSASDMPSGSFPIDVYIRTQTTLTNPTASNVSSWKPEFTDGSGDSTYLVGNRNWNNIQARAISVASGAEGNQQSHYEFIPEGSSNNKGSATMRFMVNAINAMTSDANNVEVFVNLPQLSDGKSGFDFELVGPVGAEFDARLIKYSTTPFDITAPTAPNTDALLSAGEVQDWSSIKGIYIDAGTLKVSTPLGRVIITGKDPHLTEDAGKSGYLATALYADGVLPVQTPAGNSASIQISGNSVMKTELRWADALVGIHSMPLGYTKTYTDAESKVELKDFPALLSGFSASDKAAINAKLTELGQEYSIGPNFRTSVIQNGGVTWEQPAENQTAQLGQVANYFVDGDALVYQLTRTSVESKTITRTITVHKPGGETGTEVQKATITRTVQNDPVTGDKRYSEWSEASWPAYDAPVVDGWTSTESAPQKTLNSDSTDETFDIYYERPTQEQKTITRTITLYLPDGTTEVKTQDAHVSRSGTESTKDNSITWGDWSESEWSGFAGPEKGGWVISAAAPQKTITHADSDETFEITYSRQVPESKTITRTITVHYPDGRSEVIEQHVVLTRDIYEDTKLGKQHGDWTHGVWDAYRAPEVNGYRSSGDIDEQQVIDATTDTSVEITYVAVASGKTSSTTPTKPDAAPTESDAEAVKAMPHTADTQTEKLGIIASAVAFLSGLSIFGIQRKRKDKYHRD